MKINLKTPIVNLAGEIIKRQGSDDIFTVGEALSTILINAKAGGKMKLYVLAQKIYNDEAIELDAADHSLVKSLVSESEVYGGLVIGQLELMLSAPAK